MKEKCKDCCIGIENYEYEGSYLIFESDFNFKYCIELNKYRFGFITLFNFCPYCSNRIKYIKKI